MCKFLTRCLAVACLWVCSHFAALAQGPTGLTCEDAIPVTKEFPPITVSGAGELWFTAWTYDLPISMVFVPDNQASIIAPEIDFDFSCISGEYDDPILNKYFNPKNPSYIKMPQTLSMEANREDGLKYVLSISETYRDLLARAGLTKNLQVFVKVKFAEAGTASLAVDTLYATCQTGGEIMTLGDSAQITARDSSTYQIVPFSTFRTDSIQFIWNGTAPAKIWMKSGCSSLVESITDVMDSWVMNPGDTLSLTTAEVREKDDLYDEMGVDGGLCYMYVTSEADGIISLKRKPMTPPENGAIRLEFGETYSLDTSKLYFFSKTWIDGILFETSTKYKVTAYLSKTGNFSLPIPSNPTWLIDSLRFSPTEDGHELGLSDRDLTYIRAKTPGHYVYVRFKTNDPNAKFTLWTWKNDNNECASVGSAILQIPSTINVETQTQTYRIRYSDIEGGEFKIISGITRACTGYIADQCTFSTTATNDPHVIKKSSFTSRGTVTYNAATVTGWRNRVDENGYLYFRMVTTRQGFVTFQTTAPQEQDPEPPDDPEPECEKTIHAAVSAATPHGSVQIQFVNE